MFFSKKRQKDKVIAQYGCDANSLLTMFMTYNKILTLNTSDQKEYALNEFSVNILKKYGDELTNTFYKEFLPKYQDSSLIKELSKEGQRYIYTNLCIHHHTHPTSFPLIQKVMRNYSEYDGRKYLTLLFTFRKLNKVMGEMNLDYYTIDKMQNLFIYNAMQEYGENIFDETSNLVLEYGKNELLYDELDEQNNLGICEWFYMKLIPFELRKYF